ncbi:unnamed protein product [Durusdinium trenchii]|uniref:Pentatricopeptide repeat-containing protein, chloroplastic n=1 Tax=Durusdinium trenchii TaxID=1381693 RepID=A0ABP0QVU3_9DINO
MAPFSSDWMEDNWQSKHILRASSRSAWEDALRHVDCKEAIVACNKGHAWRQSLKLLPRPFLQLKHWNPVVLINGSLSACEKSSAWLHVLDIVEEMRLEALEPSQMSISSRCRAWAQNWRQALREGQRGNVVTRNVVTSACEKAHQWSKALNVLSSMSPANMQPDVISYNASISALEKSAQWTYALAMLKHLSSGWGRLHPSEVTCNASISACGRAGEWRCALQLLEEMPFWQIQPGVVSFNAAISACAVGSEWERALQLLRALPQLRLAGNVVTATAAISACATALAWRAALVILRKLSSGMRPSVMTYNTLISAMGAHWERAIDLLWQMRSLGVQPDIVSCNAVITACDRAGVWQAALSAAHGYAMSNVTCNALLSSCAVDWLRGLSLLEEMHGRSLRMDSASLCLMGSLPWAGAHSALQTMSQWQVPPDAAAWGAVASRCSETMQWQMALSLDSNTAISTCQRAGRWSETVCMTSEMRLKSQQLDLVSLSGAASAMEKAYQWQQGLGLLEFLRAHHVPLHFWSFSLLSACEKSARWRETLALATFQERAERTPVSAGDVGYAENAQISACEKAHLWVQALQLLGSTTSPDVISFSAALSSCEKAGRWQEAELLFVALSGQVLPNLITFNAAISACEKGEALRATRLWR